MLTPTPFSRTVSRRTVTAAVSVPDAAADPAAAPGPVPLLGRRRDGTRRPCSPGTAGECAG